MSEVQTKADSAPKAARGAWLRAGIVLAVLVGAMAFLAFGGGRDVFVYSKLVNEVVDAPARFKGKALRVEGELAQGSVLFRNEPCEWRFTLKKQGKELPVRFPRCVVPDTFRDGMGISVVVEGRLEPSGAFLAEQVIPRCPSKYEMNERKSRGEAVPHAMPGPEVGSTGPASAPL